MDEETKSVEEPVKGKDEFAKVERKLRKLEKQEKWAARKLFQKKDIRYLGPLSYREFKILGWLCLSCTAVVMMMNLATKVNSSLTEKFSSGIVFFTGMSQLALPFMLLSNFTRILNHDDGYKRQLILNGAFAAVVFVLYYMFFYHFLLGSLGALTVNPKGITSAAQTYYRNYSKTGFFCFNIFIDLFLCTLFQFFLDYEPARFFKGKRIRLFRLMALLPVAYEVMTLVLKYFAAKRQINMSLFMFPLLPVKPPMTFVVFIVLALWTKTREKRFIRHGGTQEEYQEFLKSNRNSFQFARFTAILLVIAAVVDGIVFFTNTVAEIYHMAAPAIEAGNEAVSFAVSETLTNYNPTALAIGFGDSISLLPMAPIVLLYSYTRRKKNPLIDTLIPLAGVFVFLMLILQGLYQIMHILPFSGMIDLEEIMSMGSELLSGAVPL
jgi:hypothetical protein